MTMPRSGATLLGQMLGGHEDIFHIGESMYWNILNPNTVLCSCGRVGCSFLVKISREINKKDLSNPLLKVWQIVDKKFWPNKPIDKDTLMQRDSENVNPNMLDYWLKRCPSSLDAIIDIYKQYSNKTVYVDNTKLYCIGEELAKKKDWGVIILLRDPRGIMFSYKKAGIRKGDFRKAESVLPFCYEFMRSVETIQNNHNVLILKYEDMCLDPKNILRLSSKFIGISYQDLMVDFSKKKNNERGHVLKGNRFLYQQKDIKIEKEDNGWKSNLSKKELKKLYDDTKLMNLYKQFGYFYE